MDKEGFTKVMYGDFGDAWFYHEKLQIHLIYAWGNVQIIQCYPEYRISDRTYILKLMRKLTQKMGTKNKQPHINILYLAGGRLHSQEYKYNITFDLNLSEQYSEGMETFNDNLLRNLEEHGCGLHILHGEPGTGKSTYLKYLTGIVPRPFYYLTPGVMSQFHEPDLIGEFFLFKNGIFIIEESEALLKDRKSGNALLSGLLNLTSGFLGDLLNIHVICTFNCPKEAIDEALTRPGRLRTIFEAKALSVEQCKTLGYNVSKPTVIAELMNKSSGIEKKAKIGFAK
jgi:hypothetical protein